MLDIGLSCSFAFVEWMYLSKGIYIEPETGNVGLGIGVTAPRLSLQVDGVITASNVSLIGGGDGLVSTTITSDRIVLSNVDVTPSLEVTQEGPGFIANFYDSNLSLLALCRSNAETGIENMFGAVGIGTTIPRARLEIVGKYESGIKVGPLLSILNPLGNNVASFLKIYDKDNDDPDAPESGSSFTMDMSTGQGLFNLCAGCECSNGTVYPYTYTSTRGASRILMGDGYIYMYNGDDAVRAYGSNVTMVNPMTLYNSEIRLYDKLLSSDGFHGLSFNNTTTARVNLVIGNWEFEEEGGIMTPIGKTRVAYDTTGGDQTFTVPAGVTYIYAKLWGAGGGNGIAGGWSYGSMGGGGGHSRGLIPVTPSENLTIKVGAGGRTSVYATAYGGGAGMINTSDTRYGGQGGGGTYIFRGTTPLLIAGGGGGGGSAYGNWDTNRGGAGGGVQGQKGENPFDGRTVNLAGDGGRQGTGGAGGGTGVGGAIVAGVAGSLYLGGTPGKNSYGGGGGGGYYGGGGGAYNESNSMGGGGGGSGYVHSSVYLGATYTGCDRLPAFNWDNDLNRYQSNNTTRAHGGQNTQNNPGANSISGGNGYVVIYY